MNFSFFENLKTEHDFLQKVLFENTVFDYLLTVVIFILLLLLFWILQKIILSRLLSFAKKTKSTLDDTFINLLGSIKPPFYFFVAFYLASKNISLGDVAREVLDVALIVWVVYQIVLAVSVFLDYLLTRKLMPGERNTQSAVNVIKVVANIAIWTLGALFVLSNLGINITTLIAGLGVGGIAVAFALQNILGDLFSSFAIFFDKPFTEGDFIVVGDKSGIVEKIGIKTTRIRSLQGEEIVVSNQELTSAQIQNYKKLRRRRVVIEIGVAYETSQSKMKKIPGMIEKFVKKQKHVTFDRVFFTNFGDSALIFEVVYHVESSEFVDHLKAKQSILLDIKQAFEKEKIEIAYPTQTVYIQK